MEQSLGSTFRRLLTNPAVLLTEWNWKSALFSSSSRSAIFFATTLPFGIKAATGAMTAEFLDRAFAAGFYGGLTQAFRQARPERLATAVVMFGLPLFSHSISLSLHWLRGTPNLVVSIGAPFAFTIVSTAFNVPAMRQGVLIVGNEGRSLGSDLRVLPGVILSFISSGGGLFAPTGD